jgi:hypothetical protein
MRNLEWQQGADVWLKTGHGINTERTSQLSFVPRAEVAFRDGFIFIRPGDDGGKIHVVPASGVTRVELKDV